METMALMQPVMALGLWTVIIFVWMYVKRIPAMAAANLEPDAAKHPGSLDSLPSDARQAADNYNHLLEAPTLFYAMALAIAAVGHADAVFVALAWAFVGFRVLHSLVQVTVNRVMVRFSLFALSWVALAAMIVREALMLF